MLGCTPVHIFEISGQYWPVQGRTWLDVNIFGLCMCQYKLFQSTSCRILSGRYGQVLGRIRPDLAISDKFWLVFMILVTDYLNILILIVTLEHYFITTRELTAWDFIKCTL